MCLHIRKFSEFNVVSSQHLGVLNDLKTHFLIKVINDAVFLRELV